jgi:hypothetical protein
VTNRNIALDEKNYVSNANYSFLYGLKFDMSIFRCRGILSDIPNYAAYLKILNGVLEEYGDVLLRGNFVDTEGFSIDNDALLAEGYRSDVNLAVVLWNSTELQQSFHVNVPSGYLNESLRISVAGVQKGSMQNLEPDEMALLIFE